MGIFERAARFCWCSEDLLNAFIHLDELCEAGKNTKEFDDYLQKTYSEEFNKINTLIDKWNNLELRVNSGGMEYLRDIHLENK